MNRLTAGLALAAAFARRMRREPAASAGAGRREHHRADHPYRRDGRQRARPPNNVGYRSKMFASADGATISIQVGNVPKHMHPNTNEIQYILDGTGTIWLGDKEVTVKPGDLVIIPTGTPHGGTKPISGQVKAIAIKTPPQAPDDTKLLD